MNNNNRQEILAHSFSVILVILLLLPALGYFFHFSAGQQLAGYVETQTTKPEKKLTAWFDKQLQPYWEEKLNSRLGFRPLFIRLFNDLSFRLFAEQTRTYLFSTKQHGIYFKPAMQHLYEEYSKRDELSQRYAELAKKLSEIQRLFAARGKHFVVLISASKPYIHLEGIGERFLPVKTANFYDKIASLGKELKKQGVNVVDSAPLLREFYKKKAIETHPESGVHWNYYAGCIIAKQVYANVRKTIADMPALHCGAPEYKEPVGADIDGWSLLNVYSKVNLFKTSPSPTPSATLANNYLPKMLIIGDSFTYQIIDAFDKSKSVSEITFSSYFRQNIKFTPGAFPIMEEPQTPEKIEEAVLNAAIDSDVVILQMVDYNIPRLGYGFIESFLKRLPETAAKA